jgi:predicted metalloendopeptidase
MKHKSTPFVAAALIAMTMACNRADTAPAPAATERPMEPGIVTTSLDTTVKPGDDFFDYANGSWVKNTPIPEDRSSIGGFYIADQERERQTREMLDGILKSTPAAGSNEARIASYYRAYLDTAAIDAAGLAPAKADLDAIARLADKQQLSAAIGATLRADTDPLNSTNFWTENLFGVFVTQGLAGGETIPYLMQGGIGLPEREYYLSADAEMARLRDAYRAYLVQILTLAEHRDPKGAARRVMDLETKIARAHATREESEDFSKGAKVWSRAELERAAPGLDWPALLTAARLASVQTFQAYHANAIPKLAALVASEPLDAWKDWLTFHTLNQQANVLPKAFRDARFAFYGTTLSGTPQQRPRETLAMNSVSNALQDAVGKAYVDRYFPASAKAEVQHMVDEIKAAFARRVQAIDWLAPSTKQEALKKVETIVVGVGYPEQWRDYGSLTIGNDAYANQKNAGLFEYSHQLAKIGKPMDRGEWWMPPQLVNAVNLPVQNALNFPAAILQRPFFDAKADPAFNYGAIGAIIGHEISHSFDNNGALFDAAGRLRNWWTPSDFERFEQAGRALAAQFDQYEALPGLHVNGKLTLGENIADDAGLAATYDAYRHSLGGKDAPVIQGFTGDQRFFIAYAQSWASKMREQTLRQRIAVDGHAPDEFRALTVRNLDAWYPAFQVAPGQRLYLAPEQRVKVW